ncbi:MAG: protein-disulfide reductase DsbD [Gammaproteobacteria bacterium]|nr:protein-disulfide reductase DsbD [Gammaproteobacteria bacterium]
MKPLSLFASFFAALAVALAVGADDADLLPPDEAFAFSAAQTADGRIVADWQIAADYYMYRDRMAFTVDGAGRLTAPPQLPPGVLHWDSLVGEVEVYFDAVSVPLAVAAGAPGDYTLTATGQGCSVAVGVCYPPVTRSVAFTPGAPAADSAADAGADSAADPGRLRSQIDAVLRPDSAAESTDSAGNTAADDLSPGQKLRALLGASFDQTDFLEVDDAFRLTVDVAGPNRIKAAFTVADGYYLYRDKIAFSVEGAARVAAVALPPGAVKDDPYFGETAILARDFSAPVTLQRAAPEAAPLRVHAAYQGCAEDGICYAPVSKTFALQLPAATDFAPAAGGFGFGFGGGFGGFGDRGALAWPGLLGLLAGAFAAGLLLTFTPCVLPMLPILSGIIAGAGRADKTTGGATTVGGETTRADKPTRGRGGVLATAYILGSVAAYAVIGAVAGATGEQLQAYFQNAWVIGALATVLAVMALSMFGLFALRLPEFAQDAIRARSRKLGGALLPVFALGAVSAAVVGACVSPLLISFLGLAISTADAGLGAALMAAMALGMGAPLLALGLGANYLLPKAGPWMETLNQALGVMLLAVAIYLLGALPQTPILLLWGAFLVVLSVYLGATSTLPANAGGWQRLVKGAGLVLLIWGAAALVGGFFGQRDIWRPLPGKLFAGAQSTVSTTAEPWTQAQGTRFLPVADVATLDHELARAAAAGKPALVEYYADWCVDCARMERSTFRDPRVAEVLRRDFVALRVDVTDPRAPATKALKRRLRVFGPPALLFFGRDGAPLADRHFYGYMGADAFLDLLEEI